jgi:hypothetical protein
VLVSRREGKKEVTLILRVLMRRHAPLAPA